MMTELFYQSISDWTEDIILENDEVVPVNTLFPNGWCLFVLFRHAECMECNLLAHQLNMIQNHLSLWGVKVIGIGNGNAASIRRLRSRLSVSEEITLGAHPERVLHKKLGLVVSLLGAFGPKALWHTFKGLYDGHLQTSIATPMSQQSGLVLLNPKREICWLHRSRYLGDIPSYGQILEQVLIHQGGPR